MPKPDCHAIEDNAATGGNDENFSVATISMSIATDFDSDSLKSGWTTSRFCCENALPDAIMKG